jgi:hypothetical protein
MTQDKNEGSENLNWMEIADTDAINEPRHTGQRLPFIAAAVSLLVIGGGALFAQTSNEAPAQAEEISTTQSTQMPAVVSDPATSTFSIPSAATPGGVPVIPNVAPGVGKYEDDDEYEDDDRHRHEDDRHRYEDDDHDEEEDDD